MTKEICVILHRADIIDVKFNKDNPPEIDTLYKKDFAESYGTPTGEFKYFEQRYIKEGHISSLIPIDKNQKLRPNITYVVKCYNPNCCPPENLWANISQPNEQLKLFPEAQNQENKMNHGLRMSSLQKLLQSWEEQGPSGDTCISELRTLLKEVITGPLNQEEIKLVNELVEPFIHKQHAENLACASGGIERGLVITMLDRNKKLRRIRVEVLTPSEPDDLD